MEHLNLAEQVLEHLETNGNTETIEKPVRKPSVKPVVEEPKNKPQLSLFG